MNPSRREFLKRSGATGIGLLTYSVAGCEKKLTPGDARQLQLPFEVLTETEVGVLETLGDALVPGSAAAGLAHYIDQQLHSAPDKSMLMIKYLVPEAPYLSFYRSGLAATQSAATRLFGREFSDLAAEEIAEFAVRMSADDVDGWQGPPAGFFYFVLRSDAVDVFYGTPQGFAALGVPYMAHIEPPGRWGE